MPSNNPSEGKISVCTIFVSALSSSRSSGLGDSEGVFGGDSCLPDKALIIDLIENDDPNDRPPCLSSPEVMTKSTIKGKSKFKRLSLGRKVTVPPLSRKGKSLLM
jgi:hypothetical protein